MIGSPSAVPGAATAHNGTAVPEIPELLGASRDGSTMRVLVQNTFIEVIPEVTEDHKDTRRRVRSAPAAVVTDYAVEDFEVAFRLLEPVAGPYGILENSAVDHDYDDDENGGERTTVVMRNLPSNYSRAFLLDLLDAHGFAGKYDFVYMPIEFGSGTTFGFAFVNLTGPEHAAHFKAVFEGFTSWQVPCEREATVGWSWSQGYDAHVNRYRNSPVMHDAMPDDCKPVVFANGVRATFPPPTKKVPPLKRQRRRPAPGARGGASALAASAGEESSGTTSNVEGGCPLAGLPEEGFLMRGALEDVHGGVCEMDLVKQSPLASGLYMYTGELPEPGDDRWRASPRREKPSGTREAGLLQAHAAPSWADLSEDPDCPASLQGLLLPGLCPKQELREGLSASRLCSDTKDLDLHSECSTDVSSSHLLSQIVRQEHPQSGQLSSGSTSDATQRSDAVRSGARRGKRAGRRSTKGHASGAPWTGGSILLPGLVGLGPLDAGPLARIVDEHEAP